MRIGLLVGIVFGLITLSPDLFAHGEAARAGGSGTINTIGAAINDQSASFGLRFELRQFSGFEDGQLLEFARGGEDVHQHSQEMSAVLSGSFGFTDWFALDASLPVLNMFRDFREGVLGADGAVLEVDDGSAGVGDLVLMGRFRPWNHGAHHVSVLGGIKLPTGMTNARNNLGARLGAHNQPGSGSTDLLFGAAYTYQVNGFQLSVDAIGNLRTLGATNYQSGNLLQVDVGAGYAVVEWMTTVLEVNAIASERDIEDGGVLDNSGVRTVYVSPGLSFTPTRGHNFYVTASIPVMQNHPGIQTDEIVRFGLGYGITIDWAEHHDDHDHPHKI